MTRLSRQPEMYLHYYTSKPADTLLDEPGVLAIIQYNCDCAPSDTPGIIPTGLETLAGHKSEVIKVEGEIQRGQTGRCQWSTNGELLCSSIWISNKECADINTATQKAYTALLGHQREAGFSSPIRIWNFIPNINIGPGDQEEYKKFCTGRLKAFSEAGLCAESFPAASALGHHANGAVIYALASRFPGQNHENPRQEKAYRYPREHGPTSPSFARATSVRIGREKWVFVSGTASILGHETKATGDIHDQIRITVENIDVLVTHIDNKPGKLTAIRVYLRYANHLEVVKRFITPRYPDSEITYTLADICRANLLVEIEAAFKAG